VLPNQDLSAPVVSPGREGEAALKEAAVVGGGYGGARTGRWWEEGAATRGWEDGAVTTVEIRVMDSCGWEEGLLPKTLRTTGGPTGAYLQN
jgi:hypothetical protein